MSNMSYCRFQNTVLDLADCEEHVDDRDLSDDENRARKRLIRMCMDIADMYNDVDLNEEFSDNGEEDGEEDED